MVEKFCSKCGVSNKQIQFAVPATICKICRSFDMKNFYNKNKDRIKKSVFKYQKENREKVYKKQKEWRAKNPEKVRKHWANQYAKDAGKIIARNARHLQQRRLAMPKWANPFFIEEIYRLAIKRGLVMGFKWHVDHIVPLRHPKVCGLHCEANLRVIPAQDNLKKGNLFWPDMP